MKPKETKTTYYYKRMNFTTFGPQITPAYKQILKKHAESQERIAHRSYRK